MISANIKGVEGNFRRQRAYAIDRAKGFNPDFPFIVPVVIDDTQDDMEIYTSVPCRTVLKSVLTQLWCKRGTCGTLRKSMTNQLSHGNLLPDLSKVTLRRVFKTDQGWIMEAHGQNSAICPGCQRISRSRHSWYWRSLRDLPVQGTQVILRLHLGRWRCRNAVCERRIFTEPLSKVCAPYAQQTKRAGEIISAVGRALGGRPGQRLMRRLGIQVSADTLIRQVKRAARLPALPQLIRVLGVDDWAWCKGQTFGTILVDLERRQVVDLLPTRSADSLGEWLAQHPEVTTVSRDRQGVYAEGARRGAPEAVQVADRFHLVLNLTQAVERELAVNRRQLRIVSPSAPELPSSGSACTSKSAAREPTGERRSAMRDRVRVQQGFQDCGPLASRQSAVIIGPPLRLSDHPTPDRGWIHPPAVCTCLNIASHSWG